MTIVCLCLLVLGVALHLCVDKHHCVKNDEHEGTVYGIFDTVVTSLLLLEVSLRLLATRRTFFRSWFNIFDLIILIACAVGSVAIYYSNVHSGTRIANSALLGTRYVVQLARLVIVIKHHRDRQRMVSASKKSSVDFESVHAHANATSDGAGGGAVEAHLAASAIRDNIAPPQPQSPHFNSFNEIASSFGGGGGGGSTGTNNDGFLSRQPEPFLPPASSMGADEDDDDAFSRFSTGDY
jgi:hypothetical protein